MRPSHLRVQSKMPFLSQLPPPTNLISDRVQYVQHVSASDLALVQML
jgi:hypothetical protein